MVAAASTAPVASGVAASETARWLRNWMPATVGALALVTLLSVHTEEMPLSHYQAVPVATAVMVAAWAVELFGVPWPRAALVLAVALPNLWLTRIGHGGENYLFLLLAVAWVTLVGSRGERVAAVVLSFATLGVGLTLEAAEARIDWTSWTFYVVIVLLAWAIGLVLRRQDRLVAELRLRRSEAEQRGREMAALVDAARDLASTLELRPLLDLMLDHLKLLVDHAGTSIWELDGAELAFLGFRGPKAFDQDVARTVRFRVAEMGPHWTMLARGEPIRMADIRDGSDVARMFWRVVGGSAMRPSLDVITSLMWVPLVVRDHPIGLLSLTSPEREAFSERDAELALAIARQAAVAIENARLHERARQAAVLEERERLARELHDSVTQSLYAVSLHAEAAGRALADRDVEPAASNLADIRETVQEALAEMRLLLFELRPPLLQERGLAAALHTRLRAVEARAGLTTEFAGDEAERLRPEVEQELYRVAQEALNNVLKHAHASRATVRLAVGADRAALEVVDDGVGFEPALRGGDGYGLPGMRERAERLGGTLRVESAPGAGTRVRVEVPR